MFDKQHVQELSLRYRQTKEVLADAQSQLYGDEQAIAETEKICRDLSATLQSFLSQGGESAPDPRTPELESELQVQQKSLLIQRGRLKQQEEKLRRREVEFREAEQAYFEVAEAEEAVVQQEHDHRASTVSAAKKIAAAEKAAAVKVREKAREELEQQKQRDDEDQQNSRRQIYQAIKGAQYAKTNVRQILARKKRVLLESEQLEENRQAQRIHQVLELKKHTDQAAIQVQSLNAKNAAKDLAREQQEAEQFDDILNQGENPYEVFRRQRVKSYAETLRTTQEDKIQKAADGIAARMIQEDMRFRIIDEEQRRHKEYVKTYQNSLGRKYTEERTKNYISSITSDGSDMVDPSGLLYRIDPSQVTIVKDHSFGLGRSGRLSESKRRQVIEKIHAKPQHKDVQASSLLLPRRRDSEARAVDSPHDKRFDHVSSSPVEVEGQLRPGLNLAINTVTEGEDADDAMSEVSHQSGIGRAKLLGEPKQPEDVENSREYDATAPQLSDGVVSSQARKTMENSNRNPSSSLLVIPTRTVMEEQLFRKALTKQKENIVKKQVVMGREFVGPAFVARPSTISFIDFEILQPILGDDTQVLAQPQGKPMRQKITLTNVSNTFNTFKVLPLDEDIKNFFDVVYEKPGRMSAGVSCTIEVTFCPRLNEDINSELRVLAETGLLSIPIRCSIKKVLPVIVSPVVLTSAEASKGEKPASIHFRDVVIGESQTTTITIRNDGAIGSSYVIMAKPRLEATHQETTSFRDHRMMGDHGDTLVLEDDEQKLIREALTTDKLFMELDHEEVAFSSSKYLPSYGTSVIKITFAPSRVGSLEADYNIVFPNHENDAGQRLKSPSEEKIVLAFTVSATAAPLPIFIENPLVDMKCCVYGQLYRSKVVLHNRGKTAMKCGLVPPPPLRGSVEFDPEFGFIQGNTSGNPAENGKFEFQIKFRPQTDLLEAIGARWSIVSRGVFALPIRVVIPDQILPVLFTLRAQLTSSTLSYSPMSIDFGTCYDCQGVKCEVAVTNTAMLPQKIGFVKLPPEVEVEPEDGFFVLLPQETRMVAVTYNPRAAVGLQSALCLQSTLNKDLFIPCTGSGLRSPLLLSQQIVKFACTPPGSTVTTSVVLKNNSRRTWQFAAVLPPCLLPVSTVPSPLTLPTLADTTSILKPDEKLTLEAAREPHLRMTPSSATIEPSQTVRIQIDFSPPACMEAAARTHTRKDNNDQLPSPTSRSERNLRKQDGGGERFDENDDIDSEDEDDAAIVAGAPELSAASGLISLTQETGPLTPLARLVSSTPSPVSVVVQRGDDHKDGDTLLDNTGSNSSGTRGQQISHLATTPKDGNLTAATFNLRYVAPEGYCGSRVSSSSVSLSTFQDEIFRLSISDSNKMAESLSPVSIMNHPAFGDPMVQNITKDREAEPWSVHGRYIIPLSILPLDRNVHQPQVWSGSVPPLLLEVHTTTARRLLVSSANTINFGQVPVGKREVSSFSLRNAGSLAIPIRTKSLNASGPFSVLNASRPISPGGVFSYTIQFCPVAEQKYSEKLITQTIAHGEIEVVLAGEGVSPSITMDPSDGILDLGNILMHEEASSTVTVSNNSAFPVQYTLEPDGLQLSNLNGLPPFTCIPNQATISANAKQVINVYFRPDHQRTCEFETKFYLRVPTNEKTMPTALKRVYESTSTCKFLALKGRCWSHPVYFLPLDPDDEFPLEYRRKIGSLNNPHHNKLSHMNYLDDNLAIPKNILEKTPAAGSGMFASPSSGNTGSVRSAFAASQQNSSSLATPQQRSLTFCFGRNYGNSILSGANQAPSTTESRRPEVFSATNFSNNKDTSLNTGSVSSSKNPKHPAEKSVKRVIIGAIRATSGGTFEFNFANPDQKCFAASIMKGQVAAGQSVTVDISFTPTSTPVGSTEGLDGSSKGQVPGLDFDIGVWEYEMLTCKLRSTAAATNGVGSDYEVHIRLMAYRPV